MTMVRCRKARVFCIFGEFESRVRGLTPACFTLRSLLRNSANLRQPKLLHEEKNTSVITNAERYYLAEIYIELAPGKSKASDY